jgi:hypothetical protein
MKTRILTTGKWAFALTFMLMGLTFYSCTNDDNAGSSTTAQEQDAVDAISYSLSSGSNGLSRTMATATSYGAQQNLYVGTPLLECGQPYSANFEDAFTGTNYSFSYSVSRTAQMSCTAEAQPSSFAYTATYQGTYDTPRMSSDDNAVGEWTVTGLDPATNTVTFNGSYVRNGTQVSKVRNQNTFTSTLTYQLNSITVSKQTQSIVSGSASIDFAGIASNGNQFTRSGSVTFNGNGTATLVLGGNTYTINL